MTKNFDYSIIQENHKKYWGFDDMPLFIILLLAIYVFVSYLMPAYLFIPVNVLGISMEPTLYDGDKVILYRQGEINYGEIVVLYAPDVHISTGGTGEDIIKRVMGLPGDTIWFEKQTEPRKQLKVGNVVTEDEDIYILHRKHTVNGMTVETVLKDEYYTKKDIYGQTVYGTNYKTSEKYVLGENEYFVLGDNRSHSADSRSDDVGIVKKDQIFGKALFIIRNGKVFLFEKVIY